MLQIQEKTEAALQDHAQQIHEAAEAAESAFPLTAELPHHAQQMEAEEVAFPLTDIDAEEAVLSLSAVLPHQVRLIQEARPQLSDHVQQIDVEKAALSLSALLLPDHAQHIHEPQEAALSLSALSLSAVLPPDHAQ